jgi:hypothetical protein
MRAYSAPNIKGFLTGFRGLFRRLLGTRSRPQDADCKQANDLAEPLCGGEHVVS